MAKMQWQLDVELKQKELQDLLATANTYVNHDPSHGLYDVYIKIGKKAQEIADLYQKNLPA